MKKYVFSLLAALALCLVLLPGTAWAVPSSDQIIIGGNVLTLSEGDYIYALTDENGAVTVVDDSEGWNIAVTLYNGNMCLYLSDANITGTPETEYGLGIGYWGPLNITLYGNNNVTGVEAEGPNLLYSLYAQGDLAIFGQNNATLTVYGAAVQKDNSAYPNGVSASGIISHGSISINENVIVRAYGGVTNSEDSRFSSCGISANGNITFADDVQVFAEGRQSGNSAGIFCGKQFSAGHNADITATASGAERSTAITAASLSVYDNAQVKGQAMDAAASSIGLEMNYPTDGIAGGVDISNGARLRLSAGGSPKSYALKVRTDSNVNFYGGYFLLTGANRTGYDYAFSKLGGWSDNYIWRTDENGPYRAKPLNLDYWNTAYPYIEIKTGYSVMLYPNSGKIAEGKDVTFYIPGEEVALPKEADLTREGYLFDGWYENRDLSGDPVTAITETDEGEKRFYAKWAPCHTIVFDSQGGGDVESQTIKEGGTVTEPVGLTCVGYVLEGWYKEETFENLWNFETDTVTEDVTLYAKWTEKNCTVIFDTNGGSEIASQTVGANGTVSKPADPTRSGYIFGGWYKEAGCETPWNFESDTVTADLTLYAKWTSRPVDPDPPVGPGQIETKTEVKEGISEVPEGLKGIPALDTPAKLESAMRTAITQTGVPSGNTAVYDVKLLVSTDGGRTWTPATAANFPTGGLTVTLPYPEGTDKTYSFMVVHMFTTSAFGKTPGDTETPAVTNTEQGIRFTVTGLSPISVGWTIPNANPDMPPSGGRDDDDDDDDRSENTVRPSHAITTEPVSHGKVVSSRRSAYQGDTVTLTVTPDEGYVLESLTVTGNEISLTAVSAGKYTFTMPAGTVTVTAVFTPETCDGGADCPSRSFTDLGGPGTWYHEAVDFVLRGGVMGGYGNGLFRPDTPLTRAQFVQILYNLEGRPPVEADPAFSDVAPGDWCAGPVAWAAQRGITGGYEDGRFRPDSGITREQLAVMLWRYAGSPSARRELSFNDTDQAGAYALESLRRAAETGVMGGRTGGALDPKGLATRAQAARMLQNYMTQ